MTGHQFKYDYGEHLGGYSNHTVVMHVDRDATIDEMMDAFRCYLLAVGYHPDNVKDYFPEE